MADTNNRLSNFEERMRQFGLNHPEHAQLAETKAEEAPAAPLRPIDQTFSTARALAHINSEQPKFGE